MTFIYLIIALVVLGALAFLAIKAPFLTPEWKSFINYVLIVAAVITIVIFFIHAIGGNTGNVGQHILI